MTFSGKRYTRNPDVIARTVGSDSVLLNLKSGVYYKLNEVGRDVWERIDGSVDASGILNMMLAEYDVERGTLERDLAELLGDLEREGLIVAEEPK